MLFDSGDNIFMATHRTDSEECSLQEQGASIFAYYVNDPERYGVVVLDENNNAIDLEEKPKDPKSHYAVTGIYMYDNNVIDIAK